jgi:hypothetical protein
VSVLQGGLALRQHLLAYPECAPEEAIRQLENGPIAQGRYDYQTAYEVASLHGWEPFEPFESSVSGLQQAISSLAKKAKPLWARMAILGREKVRRLLDADQEQCLRYADLLKTPLDNSGMKWWDDLARFFRSLQQERNEDIGRKAERLTVAYEYTRLLDFGISARPQWIALEDNTVGYDVMSFRQNGDRTFPIHIEVKGTTAVPARFFLTRNEWDKARSIGDSYFVYVWNIKDLKLWVISLEVLSQHVPIDSGNGRWETVVLVIDQNVEYSLHEHLTEALLRTSQLDALQGITPADQ